MPSHTGCYITVLWGSRVWFLGPTDLWVPALSSGPGCYYRLQKNCGLSVGVGRAKYCLNRNSCAALYPDVANRVCECVFEGVCAGCWTGWAMWLSCHGCPSGMKLIIISLSWCVVKMQSMFCLYLPEKKKEYAKKSGVKLGISWRVIHKPSVLWRGGDWLHWGLTCTTLPLNLSHSKTHTHTGTRTHKERGRSHQSWNNILLRRPFTAHSHKSLRQSHHPHCQHVIMHTHTHTHTHIHSGPRFLQQTSIQFSQS